MENSNLKKRFIHRQSVQIESNMNNLMLELQNYKEKENKSQVSKSIGNPNFKSSSKSLAKLFGRSSTQSPMTKMRGEMNKILKMGEQKDKKPTKRMHSLKCQKHSQELCLEENQNKFNLLKRSLLMQTQMKQSVLLEKKLRATPGYQNLVKMQDMLADANYLRHRGEQSMHYMKHVKQKLQKNRMMSQEKRKLQFDDSIKSFYSPSNLGSYYTKKLPYLLQKQKDLGNISQQNQDLLMSGNTSPIIASQVDINQTYHQRCQSQQSSYSKFANYSRDSKNFGIRSQSQIEIKPKISEKFVQFYDNKKIDPEKNSQILTQHQNFLKTPNSQNRQNTQIITENKTQEFSFRNNPSPDALQIYEQEVIKRNDTIQLIHNLKKINAANKTRFDPKQIYLVKTEKQKSPQNRRKKRSNSRNQKYSTQPIKCNDDLAIKLKIRNLKMTLKKQGYKKVLGK